MENLAPLLQCLMQTQEALHSGQPARNGVIAFLKDCDPSTLLHKELSQLLIHLEKGTISSEFVCGLSTPWRRAFAQLLIASINGQAIMPQLIELRGDIKNEAETQMKAQIELLPTKMLVPLLLFMFPAFLVLLLGPILRQLIQEISR